MAIRTAERRGESRRYRLRLAFSYFDSAFLHTCGWKLNPWSWCYECDVIMPCTDLVSVERGEKTFLLCGACRRVTPALESLF